MAAMDGYSTHTDDVALLLVHHTSRGAGEDDTAGSMQGDAEDMEQSPVRWWRRHAIVTVPAELDVTNSADLGELLASMADRSAEVITANMESTTFCDSTGVHALTRARELAAANGCELRIALGGSPVARIIQLVVLDQMVPVYRDVQQSLDTPAAADPSATSAAERPVRPDLGVAAASEPVNRQ